MRDKTLPGVPTMTWHLRRRIRSSSAVGRPPIRVATESGGDGVPAAASVITSAAWRATSRVGARTRACGNVALRSINSVIVTAKTSVLPVPAFAWMMTSRPRRVRGIAACCTGDGRRYPASSSDFTMAAGRSKSLKDGASAKTSAVLMRFIIISIDQGKQCPLLGIHTDHQHKFLKQIAAEIKTFYFNFLSEGARCMSSYTH